MPMASRMSLLLAALAHATLLAPCAGLVSVPAGVQPGQAALQASPASRPKKAKPTRFDISRSAEKQYYRQTLVNFDDTQYFANITMGGQKQMAMIDTGSIELLLFSSHCKYWCGDNKNFYNSSHSLLHAEGALHVVLTYQAGTLFGAESYDSLTVGPLKVENQAFWEIVDANMPVLFDERDSDYQAIIGLGPVDPLVKTMARGTDNSNAFAVVLETLNMSTYSVCLKQGAGENGFLTWNDDVHVRQADLFSRLRVVESGFWLMKMHNVRLGNVELGCKRGCGAILDSSTTFLAAPSKQDDLFRKIIEGIGLQCDSIKSLPNLKFELDTVSIELPPDAYMAKVDGEPPTDVKPNWAKAVGSSETCEDTIMRLDLNSDIGDVWILGLPFFRSYYTVFEQGTQHTKPAVHIAKAGPDCAPSTVGKASALTANSEMHQARRIHLKKARIAKWVNHTHKARRIHNLWGGDRTIVKQRMWKKVESERKNGGSGWHPFLDLDRDGDMDEDDMLAYLHGDEVTDPDSGF